MKKTIRSDNRVSETSATYGTAIPNRMFSPASFAEMQDTEDFAAPTSVDSSSDLPPVVSFYGLKGGSGRSVCLAYCAVLLARRGVKVGVVDFDFEAPGLHAIFDIKNAKVGSLAILEDGNYRNRSLDIWKSIETIPIESKGKVMVMTAGKINADYLARLDNLRPLLWNEYDSQPITRLLGGFSTEEFDIVLVDCRTGFHGITASMLFHYSDLVVSLFPMSNQIWDGIEVVSTAWKNAYKHRKTAPGWLIVPAMVPQGKEGQRLLLEYADKLKEWFRLDDNGAADEDEDELNEESVWLMAEGIPYHPGIATEGKVPRQFSQGGPWGIFEPLVERIVSSLAVGTSPSVPVAVDYGRILEEVEIPAADGFAEFLKPEEIELLLVPSDDLKQAIDPSMGIVVGAKGSGKTLVWRCCTEEHHEWVRKDKAYTYIVGHPPKAELDPDNVSISRTGFEKIEREGRTTERDFYEQFWMLYGIYRLSRKYPDLVPQLARVLPSSKRAKLKRAMTATKPELSFLLKDPDFLNRAEDLMLATDQQLSMLGTEKIVLCYDGLDTDFQSVRDNQVDQVARRNRFIKGLLLMVSEFRGRLHTLKFKVFLREDIYLSIEGIQNRSHMEAYKKELRFQSRDLWRLAMNLVYRCSKSFREYIVTAAPGLNQPWDVEERKLKDLLDVLWGHGLGKGNKAISTNYITKRISDSKGRLFPRTFVQMLRQAFEYAKQSGPGNDRVLPHQSLTKGVAEASGKRTGDLTAEYVELKPYFTAMQGLKANFTLKEFKTHVSKAFKSSTETPDPKRINWDKTLGQLETIGVLEKKERGEGMTWSVALMYRAGLGVKGAGLS